MTDQKTLQVYADKAADYAQKFAKDSPSSSLKTFMEHLLPGGQVLDWGCGPGTSSSHLQEAGFIADPMDASKEMVALAQEKYGLKARLGTFDEPLETASYDGGWANFSLLHAPRGDLPRHIEKVQEALKPNGVFHIGLKRGSGESRNRFGRLYSYFETDELTAMLQTAGFEILKTYEGEEAGLAGTVDPFVLILAKKA